MKKYLCLLLTLTMLCGIAAPAFAVETSEPVEQATVLTDAVIVSIPEKNMVVRKYGNPETPDGIWIRLMYSDGSMVLEKVEERNNKFFAGNEEVVYIGKDTDNELYGELTANLEMNNGKIKLSYEFYSPKNPKPGIELVSATIVFIPLKNLFVFKSGFPDNPQNIILLLRYSDGTMSFEKIKEIKNGYIAGPFIVSQYDGGAPEAFNVGFSIDIIEVDGRFKLFYIYLALHRLSILEEI